MLNCPYNKSIFSFFGDYNDDDGDEGEATLVRETDDTTYALHYV